MRKINLRSLLTLLTAAFMVNCAVYAADVSLKAENRNITVIEGKSGLAEGGKITVSIFKQGSDYKNLDKFGESSYEILPYAAVTEADAEGRWRIEWENKSAGYYDIYASDGTGITDRTEKAVFITSGMEEKYSLLANGTKSELKELFGDRLNLISFVRDDDTAAQINDGKKLGTALWFIRESLNDKARIEDCINLAVCMVQLNEKKTAEALDRAVAELARCGFTLENTEKYGSLTTPAIRADMAEKLADGYSMDIKTFDKKFTENLITSGVYKAFTWRDAIDFLELTESEMYAGNKEKAARAVAGKEYTMKELLAAIENAVNDADIGGKPQGSGGGKGGGSGNGGSGGGIAVPPTVTDTKSENTDSSAKVTVFRDVEDTHWAYDAVNYLRWKEIVCGDEQGMFNPENNITRAEIIKILCGVFEIEAKNIGAQLFGDVAPDNWAFGYINAAKELGLINGDENDDFKPNENVSRQDLAVLIYRFAENAGRVFEESSLRFDDSNRIAEYAEKAVGCMSGSGIVNGTNDNRFMPEEPATRAQTAVMIYRLLMTK